MKQRNATIDYLRGLAALMVCVCHYRHTLPDHLAAIAKHGEIGVQIFFVISGFIIPYSMEKSGYKLIDFGRFWLKRIVRLQPTFLAALIFTFLLSRASSHFKGAATEFSLPDLVASAVYLRVPSENPVIWTLIVELKYYLFISLLFPLLFSRNDMIRRSSFVGCLILATGLTPYAETLQHAPCFLLGFAACYLRTGRSTPRESLILSILVIAAAFTASSTLQIAAGVLTSAAILYLPVIHWRLGAFFGAISYSLYLVHFPLGVKIVNVSLPRFPGSGHWVLMPITIAICSAVAYALFKLVEEPSARWSQQIKLSKATISDASTRTIDQSASV
ncbi:MAG TPA: acyltransferase [Lacunisphaera sp.]|jgi:peptidoglycan/LPS O-acetylase OafA/YrhL